MEVTKNEKTQTAMVSNVTKSGLKMNYSVPIKGATFAQKLTIKQGKSSVHLTNSQVRSLSKVITKARRLAK